MNDKLLTGDCLNKMKELKSDSIDLIVTDPPYGYSFLGKDWDRALPSVEIYSEMLRVLKPGAFAFIMCAPRQDVLSKNISNISAAGFNTNFTSIYWTYASGFPKASNISKKIDKNPYNINKIKDIKNYINQAIKKSGKTKKQINKECGFNACSYARLTIRKDDGWGYALPNEEKWKIMKKVLGFDYTWDWPIKENERLIIGKKKSGIGKAFDNGNWGSGSEEVNITVSKSELGKKFQGAYGGFQPKPAVEVILVCMKPLTENTFVAQALNNGKGIVWFDDCRIPFENTPNPATNPLYRNENIYKIPEKGKKSNGAVPFQSSKNEINKDGRFPANLLVSDDVLNDGRIIKSIGPIRKKGTDDVSKQSGHLNWKENKHQIGKQAGYNDEGSYSRYFDLDNWFKQNLPESVQKTFPYLIVPKASKSEKNMGLDHLEDKSIETNVRPQYCKKCGKRYNDRYISANSNCKCSEPEIGLLNVVKKNNHATVKPVKLMAYLITMGSRKGDLVLDPFMGSGTTGIAANLLDRRFIGIELSEEYMEIATARIQNYEKHRKYILMKKEKPKEDYFTKKPKKNVLRQNKEKQPTNNFIE